jgi:hypothetical protein
VIPSSSIEKKFSKRVQHIKGRGGISKRTASAWINALGYKYCEQSKSYYIDAHEREDVVRYRNKFVDRYTDSDKEMIEFHIDSISDDIFSDLHPVIKQAEEANMGLGAQQSWFRHDKKRKILISIGQDECIFKQNILNKKAWQSSDGRFLLRPKDDGHGIMVSAFTSRCFGFGFPTFENVKDKVNQNRRGKCYTDVKAAMRIHLTANKKDLEEDPFIRLFEYGNVDGKEGYWTYDHMVLQLEDVIDTLHAAFGNKFDVLFLFDHSCGHDKMRPDALNVAAMNVGFGGSASKMHPSKIEQLDGYLGTFFYDDRKNEQLQVGDTQNFIFTEEDVGPLY